MIDLVNSGGEWISSVDLEAKVIVGKFDKKVLRSRFSR
jgi:hypothetical protein